MEFDARTVEFLDEPLIVRDRRRMHSIQDYPRRHTITVEEYIRMGEAYVFGPHARLELVEGELVEMAPISCAHASVVSTLAELLTKAAARRAFISEQNPLVLGELSALQPDVMLLWPRADHYYGSHPAAKDAIVVVEVAETTSKYDLEVKGPLYARAGVAELWIVDIDRRELHMFCGPERHYSIRRVLTANDRIAIAALADTAFQISALFPAL